LLASFLLNLNHISGFGLLFLLWLEPRLEQLADLGVYFVRGVACQTDQDVALLVVVQQRLGQLMMLLKANLECFLFKMFKLGGYS